MLCAAAGLRRKAQLNRAGYGCATPLLASCGPRGVRDDGSFAKNVQFDSPTTLRYFSPRRMSGAGIAQTTISTWEDNHENSF